MDNYDSEVEEAIEDLAEEKFLDTRQSSILTDSYYLITIPTCTAIPLGNTGSTRIGNRIRVTTVAYRFVVTPRTPPGPSIKFWLHRLLIFKWYDTTSPQWNDILGYIGPAMENVIQAPYEHDKKVKWKVLVDETISTSFGQYAGNTSSTSEGLPLVFHGYIDFKGESKRVREVRYDGAFTSAYGHIYYGILGCEQEMNLGASWYTTTTLTSSYIRVNYLDY